MQATLLVFKRSYNFIKKVVGDMYHKVGNIYQIVGDVYLIVGDINHVVGDVYHVVGDVYHIVGDVYHVVGDVYHMYRTQCSMLDAPLQSRAGWGYPHPGVVGVPP